MFALHHDQRVVRQVLRSDVPGGLAAVLAAADAKAMALPQRVVHEPAVLADRFAFRGTDGTQTRREIPREELSKRPFPDKADAGAVLLVEDIESPVSSDAANLILLELAQGKQGLREGIFPDGMQEIALVLVLVHGLPQLHLAVSTVIVI